MFIVDVIGKIAFLFILGGLLVYSTGILINSFARLSRITHLSKFGITALVMALATSLPELIVGIMSALEGTPSLSLGNVIGSNMSNLSLVVGGAAVVGGGVSVMGAFLRKDLLLGAIVGSLPLVMLLDGSLSRLDGIVLVLVYLLFVRTIVYERPVNMVFDNGEELEPIYTRFFAFFGRKAVKQNLLHLIFGLVLLSGSGYALVEVAQNLAVTIKVPLLLIGLFLVSFGTTLPELSFAIKAVKGRQVSMIFGNLLGSIAANSTVILGIVAIITPVTPNGGLRPYLLGTFGYVILFAAFYFFAATKKRLTRWEGAVLILIYFIVMGLELSGA